MSTSQATGYRVCRGCCAYVPAATMGLDGTPSTTKQLVYGGDAVPTNTPPEDIARLLETGVIEPVCEPEDAA